MLFFLVVGVSGCASVLVCVPLLRLIRVDIVAPSALCVRVWYRVRQRELERDGKSVR